MTNPYPLPRETRETPIILGDGRATYGTFNFRIWDVDDVVAVVSRAGANFLPESILASKAAGEAFADFSVTFVTAPLVAGDRAIVRSKRLHERSTDIVKGGALSGNALEREFSVLGTIQQELRRDADSNEAAIILERIQRITDAVSLRLEIAEAVSPFINLKGELEIAIERAEAINAFVEDTTEPWNLDLVEAYEDGWGGTTNLPPGGAPPGTDFIQDYENGKDAE